MRFELLRKNLFGFWFLLYITFALPVFGQGVGINSLKYSILPGYEPENITFRFLLGKPTGDSDYVNNRQNLALQTTAAQTFSGNNGSKTVNSAPTVLSFTNTTSGSWGNPATWGGAGVPGPNDTVTIIANTTVTLDADRSVHELTINFFGSLQLDGHRFDIVGDGAVLNLNGRIENSNNTFTTFNLVGNGTPGGITQTWNGGGGCTPQNPCNFELRLTNGVKVSSATGVTLLNTRLTVDAGCDWDISGRLDYYGSFTEVFVINNNGSIRNGRLTTERLVRITGGGTIDSEFVVNSGTTEFKGELKRLVGIQSSSTLRMTGDVNFYGDFNISSGTLDMNGSAIQFLGNNVTLVNTGTLVNNGAHNTISFVGNGTPGGVTQTLFSTVSPFPINSTTRLMNNVTLKLGEEAAFSYLFVQAGSTLDAVNKVVRLRGAGIALTVQGTFLTTGSTIEMNGTALQSIAANLNGAAYNNLTINNPGGVDIPGPGANTLLIPGTLRLAAGLFTTNGNLSMGNGSTIARSQGSLSQTPIFNTSVNLNYYGFQTIESGAEIPPPNVLNDLTLEDFGDSLVNLNSDVTVNGKLTVSSNRKLGGAPGRTLILKGSAVVNSGGVTHPSVIFNSPNNQTLSGTSAWSGNSVVVNGPGSVTTLTPVNFFNASFINNATLASGSNFITFRGANFTNNGTITGNFQTMDTVTLNAGLTGFNAAFRVFSGTTTAKGRFASSLTVQSVNAALQVAEGDTVTVDGNTTIDGQLSGGGTFRTNGAFNNNSALISVSSYQMGGAAQTLGGTGGFSNNLVTILSGSTTTLTANKQLSFITIDAGATFIISNRTLFLSGAGVSLNNSGSFTNTNSTVEYNGTGPQAMIVGITPVFHHLSINNVILVESFSGLTVNGLLTVKRATFTIRDTNALDVQVNSGATLSGVSGTTVNVRGGWVNNGAFLANQNTVNFNGTTAQNISGSNSTTFDNLTKSAGPSLTLAQNIAVNRVLTLGADVNTGANVLSMPSTGTSAGTADVIGNVRRTGFVAGGNALSFGNPFNSIAFAVGGTPPTEVNFNLAKTAPVGLSDAVLRTYTISQTGGSGFQAKLRLHYLDGELNGNAEPQLKLYRLDGEWQNRGASAIDTANNWVEKNGVTQFSQWALRTGQDIVKSRTLFDFDGDGKTDIGIFRPSDGSWWYLRSSGNDVGVFSFGASTDVIAPGDFTGDGKADLAVFRPSTGEWYIQRSNDNSFFSFPFGANGDVPTPADFDGDGKTDAAVFRPSSGTWFILNSNGSGTSIVNFGTAEDKPVPADFDGDGKADIAIFRPSDGSWWYLRSIDSQFRVFRFGVGTDKPVQGDYTGDGKADIAVFRPSTGEWFVQRSEDGSYFSLPFGASGDLAVPGDYDGDGRFDTAVFRPASSTWFLNQTTAGVGIINFGITGDRPVPNAFVP